MEHKRKIHQLLKKGEGITLEFKECKNNVPKSLYETVCAFLNFTKDTLYKYKTTKNISLQKRIK